MPPSLSDLRLAYYGTGIINQSLTDAEFAMLSALNVAGINALSNISSAANNVALSEETLQRDNSGDNILLTTGIMSMAVLTAKSSRLVSKVRIYSSGTASAGITLARIGIYELDDLGNGTLVASTPNTVTLGNTTFTIYTVNLSASLNLVAGKRYAVGVLMVGTTMPTFYGAVTNFWAIISKPYRGGYITSADLPASYVTASVGPGSYLPYIQLLESSVV